MLDGIRKSGKWIVLAFLLFMLAGIVLGGATAGIGLLEAVLRGDIGSALILLVVLAAFVAVIWLIVCILRQTPAEAADLEKLRRAKPFAKDGGSEAPGVSKRDPWLG